MSAVDCDGFQHELPDLLYGEVDPEVRPLLDAHRAGCAACAALVGELEAVKGALPPLRPPPLLQARVKLAARDELLARQAALAPGPAPPVGPTLHLAAAAVLAACVGAVGFVLGASWQGGEPRLPVPRGPGDVAPDVAPPDVAAPASTALPAGGPRPRDPDEVPSAPPARPVPRAPEAWQRVLFDGAAGFAARGDARQARELLRRAVSVAPDGPLAAEAQVALAALLLASGDAGEGEEARGLLRATRRDILGGRLAGGPALLQRIADLLGE